MLLLEGLRAGAERMTREDDNGADCTRCGTYVRFGQGVQYAERRVCGACWKEVAEKEEWGEKKVS